MGVLVPTEYGGSGFSYTEYVTNPRIIHFRSFCWFIYIPHSLYRGLFYNLETRIRKKVVTKTFYCRMDWSLGLTEHNTGSDVVGMKRLRAVKDGEF